MRWRMRRKRRQDEQTVFNRDRIGEVRGMMGVASAPWVFFGLFCSAMAYEPKPAHFRGAPNS